MRKFHANANLLMGKFGNCSPDVKCYVFNNGASQMFANLNSPSFCELIRKYAFSFINRVISSNNLYFVGLYKSTVQIHSRIWDSS